MCGVEQGGRNGGEAADLWEDLNDLNSHLGVGWVYSTRKTDR